MGNAMLLLYELESGRTRCRLDASELHVAGLIETGQGNMQTQKIILFSFKHASA